jgi:hypothetical protein
VRGILRAPSPAGSFLGGFRTPATGVCRAAVAGRHPKPYTNSEVARVRTGCPFYPQEPTSSDRPGMISDNAQSHIFAKRSAPLLMAFGQRTLLVVSTGRFAAGVIARSHGQLSAQAVGDWPISAS